MNRLIYLSLLFISASLISGCGGEELLEDRAELATVEQGVSPTEVPVYTTPNPRPEGLGVLRRSIVNRREQTYLPVDIHILTANDPMLTGATVIGFDDTRIRYLGGRHSQPLTWPGLLFWWPQGLSTIANPVYETGGYSFDRMSGWDGFQFILPAGQRQFELFTIDAGFIDGVYIEIDGVRTSPEPLSLGHGNRGDLRYTLLTLPPSVADRDIRIVTQRSMLGEIRLPYGGKLGARRPEWDGGPKVVFVGDSITEGTGAGSATDGWAIELAYRLGIDDPVVSALGGTGYLNRVADRPNFREHISDVLDAFPGDRPDVVFVAGGINDCAFNSASDVGNEALAYFQEMRAAAPDMAIVVFGPFVGPAGYDPVLMNCAEAIFAAARSVPNTHTIDVSGWVTPTTSTFIFNGDGSDPHPVRTGHRYYAKVAEQAVLKLLEDSLPGDKPGS
ncbi:SGNH/GDSL hydrolase family protein [Qipengyuania sphaerica]|uniref:SGNH/GDSL hydrolase family protein n=1 Tax=Qipengyuania sphaerica TaxID=2867243 RepID=UPI001C88BFF9|nr:SGNH/GDSL hydrolase family protein [Qipengyuania sphaerica]MBX7541742.1 SGNH/GDSL hydrolase family protein [Qipengyuania sphaerica]